MKSKKVTMLAAALVVAVVALAGVGYAVAEYKATTTNTDNNLGYTYLKIEQAGAGAYTDNFFSAAYFNTANTGTYDSTTHDVVSSTTYIPVKDYATPTADSALATGTDVALVSKVLQLTITPENIGNKTTAALSVTVDSLTPVAGLTYYMVLATPVENSNPTTYTCVYVTTYQPVEEGSTSYSWNFGNIAISNTVAKDYYVMLFIGGNTAANASLTAINTAGFSANCGFTFTLTETV